MNLLVVWNLGDMPTCRYKSRPLPGSLFLLVNFRVADPDFLNHHLTAGGRMSTITPEIEGRMPSMAERTQQRVNLFQGTLDMVILRTLLYGPAHGHQIGKQIQRTTNDFVLYPALHRLERRGWVSSKWEMAPDRKREFKYYRLTDKGRKQLVVEESQWKQMAELS